MPEKPNTWKNQNLILQEGSTSNARKAYEYFLQRGLTPNQSAGIVGNLAQESTLKLDSGIEEVTDRKDKGFGIAQWTFSRRGDLDDFAKTQGTKSSDFNTQLDFIWHELNTTEKRALKKLKETNSTTDAAIAFNKSYERSHDSNHPDSKAFTNRIKFANRFADSFTGIGDLENNEFPVNTSVASNVTVPEISNDQNLQLEFFNQVTEVGKKVDAQNQKITRDIQSQLATKNLQDKIKERDFIASLIENTEVSFIKRK